MKSTTSRQLASAVNFPHMAIVWLVSRNEKNASPGESQYGRSGGYGSTVQICRMRCADGHPIGQLLLSAETSNRGPYVVAEETALNYALAMPLRDYIGWTTATLGSFFLGAALLDESYLLFSIGLTVFAFVYFCLYRQADR